MHHIFYVENGISLALVKAYIDETNLPYESIIVLLGRGIQAKVPYTTYDVKHWEFKPGVNFLKGWKKTNEIKLAINRYLKDKHITSFHFYTSSISKLSCYFLLRHSANVGNAMIEDGRAAYYSESEFKAYIQEFHYSSLAYPLYQLKCWLNYRLQHYPAPKKTIGFIKRTNNAIVSSKRSFDYITNKYIVKKLFQNYTADYQEIECLMCLSYPVEDNLISLENYKEVLKRTFEFLIDKGIKQVHYKFHPQQLSIAENLQTYLRIITSYKNQLDFVELPNSTIMEEVVANSNTTLVSDYSSTMIYADVLGNQIISNYGLIQAYKEGNENMPRLPGVLTSIIHNSNIPLRQ